MQYLARSLQVLLVPVLLMAPAGWAATPVPLTFGATHAGSQDPTPPRFWGSLAIR
jgi:hypothetical protein